MPVPAPLPAPDAARSVRGAADWTAAHAADGSGAAHAARLRDPERLAALASAGLLDAAPEESFDRHTRLAMRLLGVPVALVSLVDADRQFFMSCFGVAEPWQTARETPLSHSFCQYVVVHATPLVIDDARRHAVLRDNLAIRDLGVVAYLGVPLTTPEGRILGSLCAIDGVPRAWSADDVATLSAVAAGVMHEITLRRRALASEEARERSEAAHEAVIDQVGETVFRADAAGRWTALSPMWRTLTGYDCAASLGEPVFARVHAADRRRCEDAYAALVGGAADAFHETARLTTRDGRTRAVEMRARVLRDATAPLGAPLGVVGTLTDVTEREETLRALAERERELRLAVEVAGLSLWEHPLPGGAEALTDASLDARLGPVHADDRALVRAALAHAVHAQQDVEVSYRYVQGDGVPGWRTARARAVGAPEGDGAGRLVGVTLCTTARKRAEAQRETTVALLEATLEATADGVIVVDLNGRVARYNRRFLELWRLTPELVEHVDRSTLIGRLLQRTLEPERYAVLLEELVADPSSERTALVELTDGSVFECTMRPQRMGDGRMVGRVWGFRDITERAVLEEQLTHQAFHDALTGLPNRAAFHGRVERALARADQERRPRDHVAVLLLDLDGFKLVNDSNGHAIGDELLVAVADRLLNATRGSDFVARLGGDEFGVLLEQARDEPDARRVAERIVQALAQPFSLRGASVVVGASIGYARGGSVSEPLRRVLDARHGLETRAARALRERRVEPVDALLRNADLALYDAKAQGKGRWASYHPALHAAAVERLSLETALRRGLERDEFRLVYQPIVDLETGRPLGVEALVRWHHPERGVVAPMTFIPLAEETGLIVPLGRWVLEEACRTGARWARGTDGQALGYLTVNISGRQLGQPDFVETVTAALAASGMPPAFLVLEITESAVVQQPELALTRLEALKALGVRLAIDDFGTGYSSLSYLNKFPIDVLKIDKSFVDQVTDGGQPTALTSAIIALGDALSLRTVAEGVESAEQLAALRGMGCAAGQGFLFARPLDAHAVDALLAAPLPPPGAPAADTDGWRDA